MGVFSKFLNGFNSDKSSISVNGKIYQGNSIQIKNNGEIYIDGVKQDTPDEKQITINIQGDVNVLDTKSSTINVTGNVNSLDTTSGDVEIGGDVYKGVRSTSGDIDIKGSVSGDISTSSGDVECSEVGGNIKTSSGDVDKKFK